MSERLNNQDHSWSKLFPWHAFRRSSTLRSGNAAIPTIHTPETWYPVGKTTASMTDLHRFWRSQQLAFWFRKLWLRYCTAGISFKVLSSVLHLCSVFEVNMTCWCRPAVISATSTVCKHNPSCSRQYISLPSRPPLTKWPVVGEKWLTTFPNKVEPQNGLLLGWTCPALIGWELVYKVWKLV